MMTMTTLNGHHAGLAEVVTADSYPPSVIEAGLLGNLRTLEHWDAFQRARLTAKDFHVWTNVPPILARLIQKYAAVPPAHVIQRELGKLGDPLANEWAPPPGNYS